MSTKTYAMESYRRFRSMFVPEAPSELVIKRFPDNDIAAADTIFSNGVYAPATKVRLNQRILAASSDLEIDIYIVHELAHVDVGILAGHGRKWAERCADFGLPWFLPSHFTIERWMDTDLPHSPYATPTLPGWLKQGWTPPW